jgi:hypothetical protein
MSDSADIWRMGAILSATDVKALWGLKMGQKSLIEQSLLEQSLLEDSLLEHSLIEQSIIE